MKSAVLFMNFFFAISGNCVCIYACLKGEGQKKFMQKSKRVAQNT